jgi:hypothetical protein
MTEIKLRRRNIVPMMILLEIMDVTLCHIDDLLTCRYNKHSGTFTMFNCLNDKSKTLSWSYLSEKFLKGPSYFYDVLFQADKELNYVEDYQI